MNFLSVSLSAVVAANGIVYWKTMMMKFWVIVYGEDDREITRYRVHGNTRIDVAFESVAFNYPTAKLIQIALNPPDESRRDETSS
jgi:hypothetical protein